MTNEKPMKAWQVIGIGCWAAGWLYIVVLLAASMIRLIGVPREFSFMIATAAMLCVLMTLVFWNAEFNSSHHR